METYTVTDRTLEFHDEVQQARRYPFNIYEVVCGTHPIVYLSEVGALLCGQSLFVTQDTMAAYQVCASLVRYGINAAPLVDGSGEIVDLILGDFLMMNLQNMVAPVDALEKLPGFCRVKTIHYIYSTPSQALADRLLEAASRPLRGRCPNPECPNDAAAVFYHTHLTYGDNRVRRLFPW